MDRFITHEGQMPIWLGDIDYITGVFRDTVKHIMEGLGIGSKTFILSGFDVTSSFSKNQITYNWNEGAVVIDGEIYRVDAGSLPVNTSSGPMQSPIGLKIIIGYDTHGSRQLKSGDVKECWQTRRAVVARNHDVPLRGLRRFEEILAEKVTGSLSSFREEDLINEQRPVRFDSGTSAGVCRIKITSISGALYMMFRIGLLKFSEDEQISKFLDTDIECRTTEEAAKIVNAFDNGTAAFSFPFIKTDSSGQSAPSSLLCMATISRSTSKAEMIHVRITPSEPIKEMKIRGKCFIRLEY